MGGIYSTYRAYEMEEYVKLWEETHNLAIIIINEIHVLFINTCAECCRRAGVLLDIGENLLPAISERANHSHLFPRQD